MTKDNLLTTVLSSAVKTSLSQQKTVPKKKAIVKKKKKPAPGPSQQPNVVKKPAAEAMGWLCVGSKKPAKTKPPPAAVAKAKPPSKKAALTSNAFYLPKSLEKKLHQAKSVESKKRPFEEQEETLRQQKLTKCQRKNQARSQKRAEQRLMKEKATLLQKKVALLQDKAALLQQQVQSMTINDDEETASISDETAITTESSAEDTIETDRSSPAGDSLLLALPYEVLTNGILSFLRPEEMVKLGSTCKSAKTVCEEGYLWQSLFRQRFPASSLSPQNMKEWKTAYQLSLTNIVDRLRCFSTQKTFMEDVLGVLVDYTVNPKRQTVDHVELSQDLLSETAFVQNRVRTDVFGNSFKLFLPLYFSEEHFQRALPRIQKTIVALARDRRDRTFVRFHPFMILDVFPKIVTTFVVLLSDQGIAACRKSYDGITRIHRLFLALAHQYPKIQTEALRRLKLFIADEKNRVKSACPNLGAILPLLMIVDDKVMGWPQIRIAYVRETFDRMVLWACKQFPQLERTHDSITGVVESEAEAEQRVELTLQASIVNLRLMMFHVYFLKALCKGTTQERANRYDCFFGQPEPKEMEAVADAPAAAAGSKDEAVAKGPTPHSAVGFGHFRDQINHIVTVQTWQKFIGFVGLPCPSSKAEMARRLRCHVANSRRKKYHTAGMDFNRVQASGTSRILSKGEQYSANSDLRRVIFRDTWKFQGGTKYLDATCLLYKGKKLLETVDYRNRQGSQGAVVHSGDVMTADGGTHTISLDLARVDAGVTSCVFVLSAWASATLADILSPSVSFDDADADEDKAQLCTYDLAAQDKVSYLTSVVMCRLYRVSGGHKDGKWHVQAIGDSHKGDATDYTPIYQAVAKLL
ncbi:ubiquitin-conjugating enzyme [Seminavis robusta]|uniref:Ubiquitin-conjugating enzyme n=1 Tax=Seminavis robusta TaxID=568900 RepID=A0A9N8EEB4_9STRA|nr:ubiquitin-conjugating enzyme [Seminavis robusta]|eukprot:Sro1056_g236140.1 ubiquitin-conjugating enzyme (864) ;mRNA; r:4854-7445